MQTNENVLFTRPINLWKLNARKGIGFWTIDLKPTNSWKYKTHPKVLYKNSAEKIFEFIGGLERILHASLFLCTSFNNCQYPVLETESWTRQTFDLTCQLCSNNFPFFCVCACVCVFVLVLVICFVFPKDKLHFAVTDYCFSTCHGKQVEETISIYMSRYIRWIIYPSCFSAQTNVSMVG